MWTRHRGYKSYYGHSSKSLSQQVIKFFSFLGKSKSGRRQDYWQKSYHNPYFSNKRWAKRTKAPRLKLTIFFVATLGVVGILLFHPFFYINQVTVTGNEKVSTTEVKSIVESVLNQKKWLVFSGRNIFTANLVSITKEIRSKYILASLQTDKDYPQTLKIMIKEKESKLVLQVLNSKTTQYRFYLLDNEGEVLQEINIQDMAQPNISILPRIQKEGAEEIKITTEVVSRATIEFINYLNENIPKQNKVTIAYTALTDEGGQVLNIVTQEGWKIVVDRLNDWKKQLHVLDVILREKIKDNRQNLKYIDIRYENRAFFQ